MYSSRKGALNAHQRHVQVHKITLALGTFCLTIHILIYSQEPRHRLRKTRERKVRRNRPRLQRPPPPLLVRLQHCIRIELERPHFRKLLVRVHPPGSARAAVCRIAGRDGQAGAKEAKNASVLPQVRGKVGKRVFRRRVKGSRLGLHFVVESGEVVPEGGVRCGEELGFEIRFISRDLKIGGSKVGGP